MLGGRYELIAPHLSEKQRRLLAGAAAKTLGRGGGARMAPISGLSRPTVYAGVHELDDPPDPGGRTRRRGGGPKRLVQRQPGLLEALDALVDPDTRGDPESPLRTPAGIRSRRCGGPASPPASWPTRWARKDSRSATTPSGGCSSSSATRCSAPERPRRAPSTRPGRAVSLPQRHRPWRPRPGPAGGQRRHQEKVATRGRTWRVSSQIGGPAVGRWRSSGPVLDGPCPL